MSSSPLDRLLADAPKNSEFVIYLGDEKGDPEFALRFRMVHSFYEIQQLKEAAAGKARETYESFTGESRIDQKKLETLAQCFLMDSLAIDPTGSTTTEKFWRLATEFGGMFGAVHTMFSAKLAMGEAAAATAELEEAKND